MIEDDDEDDEEAVFSRKEPVGQTVMPFGEGTVCRSAYVYLIVIAK